MDRAGGQRVRDLNAAVGTEFAPPAPVREAAMGNQGQARLRGKFASLQGSLSGVRIGVKATMRKAPDDGHYLLNGGRFKARKGDAVPDGAEFVPAVMDTRAPEGRRATNQGIRDAGRAVAPELQDEVSREEQTADHPKWYLAYVSRQAKAGAEVQPMYVGETEAAFTARLGAMGPESTEGTGGAETT